MQKRFKKIDSNKYKFTGNSKDYSKKKMYSKKEVKEALGNDYGKRGTIEYKTTEEKESK